MTPIYKTEHLDAMETARKRLDAAVFTAAWEEGQAMTLEQAIACALDEEGDSF